jgi:hypothetical protein
VVDAHTRRLDRVPCDLGVVLGGEELHHLSAAPSTGWRRAPERHPCRQPPIGRCRGA